MEIYWGCCNKSLTCLIKYIHRIFVPCENANAGPYITIGRYNIICILNRSDAINLVLVSNLISKYSYVLVICSLWNTGMVMNAATKHVSGIPKPTIA